MLKYLSTDSSFIYLFFSYEINRQARDEKEKHYPVPNL